jgi:hypothetical protein
MPETWSIFVSRLNAAHAQSARKASDTPLKLLFGAIWLVVFVANARSGPHDFAVLQRELSTVPLARIFGARATGEFALRRSCLW